MRDPKPLFGEADKHARETVRLWKAGEQTNPWPEQDANLAAAYLALRKKVRYVR